MHGHAHGTEWEGARLSVKIFPLSVLGIREGAGRNSKLSGMPKTSDKRKRMRQKSAMRSRNAIHVRSHQEIEDN